jgi:molecular chaperone GrpE
MFDPVRFGADGRLSIDGGMMENTDPMAVDPRSAEATGSRQAQVPDENVDELENLTRQLGEAEAKLGEMRETVLRERAEIDNQRKRLQRDLDQARRFANEKLLGDLLPVIDNLERGLAAEGGDIGALRDGIGLTLREFIRVIAANGMKAVGSVGEPFDPELHQAMAMVDAGGQPSGLIVDVMQKGYVLNERLLRPALVSVSK